MNHIYKISLAIFIILVLPLRAQNPNDWEKKWITAIELSKEQDNFPKAIENYSSALQAFNLNQPVVMLNLLNERANLYLKMGDFNNAINDFSFVLNHPKVIKEQKIEALRKRSIAYLVSRKTKEFQDDCDHLDRLEPAITTLEDNQNYTIYKLAPRVLQDAKGKERFIDHLIQQKEIKSTNEVTFASTGFVIIKKSK